MTTPTPPQPPAPPPPSRGPGHGGPPQLPPAPPPGEGRSVSFFVAIFLAFLLLISAGLNILLFTFTVFSGSGMPSNLREADEQNYQVLVVDGDPEASTSVLRVPIDGAIAEQGSVLLGAAGGTVSQVRRALSLAERRQDVRAILLDINSPGGGVTDSDLIWQMLVDFKARMGALGREMVLVAHFGDISASGGYYIATACDRIVARRTSITGSIGVIMSSYQISEALDKLGVKPVVIKSDRTPYKDIMSMDRPMTESERAMLEGIVDHFLDRFVEVVDKGRPELTRQQVLDSATGAIFAADEAKRRGLVDAVETSGEVLAWIEGHLNADGLAVIEQRRRPGLGDVLFGADSPKLPTSEVAALEKLAMSLMNSSRGQFHYLWSGR